MHCLYCRQKIGAFRSLCDSRFCCFEHKRFYGTHSSRVLREKEDIFAPHEPWAEEQPPQGHRKGQNLIGFVLCGCAVLVFACANLFTPAADVPREPVNFSLDNARSKKGMVASTIDRMLGNARVLRAQDNFQTDLSSWRDLKPGAEWAYESGRVRPGKLRLWTPSEKLANYDFEFIGQIERKSMGYAFRATDARNYYATKLTVASTAAAAQSELIRYLVLDGKVRDRVQLPIPFSIEKGTDYRIHLSVRGPEFLTSIDGQLVSTWRDRRLLRGGVGFFSEDGESSLLKWASISERDSVVGRLLSHFSLLALPPALAQASVLE